MFQTWISLLLGCFCIDSMAMPRMLSFWAGLYVSFCSLTFFLLALGTFLEDALYTFFWSIYYSLLIKKNITIKLFFSLPKITRRKACNIVGLWSVLQVMQNQSRFHTLISGINECTSNFNFQTTKAKDFANRHKFQSNYAFIKLSFKNLIQLKLQFEFKEYAKLT